MHILSFISDHDLAGFILSLAGQSILVSLIGITVIRLLSGKSAPVRSLVCSATITALGLIFVIFLGYRLYDADFTQYAPAGVDEREIKERIIIPPPVRELQLPIEQLPIVSPSPSSVSFHEPLPDSGDIVINQTVSAPYSLSVPLKEQAIIFINALGLIWLLGLLFQVLRLCYGLIVVKRFKGSLEPVKDASFNNMLSNIAVILFRKGRLVPRLYRSSLIESPMAIGFIHPAIIIPEKLFTTLTDNELKSILLHEMAHIFHYDQVTGIIKRFVIAFHWWNPFVYIINKEHEQAREEVSDNYVLNELSPGDYSRCLMNLAEKVSLISNIPFASGMAGRGFNLIKRVEQILSNKRSNAMNTRLSFKTIVFMCIAVLTFGIAGIHARVKSVEPNNEVEEIKEPLPVINTVSITKEDQNLEPKNIPESAAVEKSETLNAVTVTQKELPVKQIQENTEPLVVMASINTKAMHKIETPMDSVSGKQIDVSVKQKDEANTITLAQNETVETPDVNSTTIPDKAVLNVIPKDAANDSIKEDIDTANADLTRQIEVNGSDAKLYILRGNLHMDKQDYEKAVNNYTKAIEINPDDITAYNNRGLAYANLGEHEQAIKDYKKVIKKDPSNIYAYINRGNAYYEGELYLKAISDYTRAIKIDPKVSLAYINRGIVYQQRNSLRKAINDFSKALELDNRDAGTYLLRGNVYLRKGEYRQAIDDYNKALEINPDLINAYNTRGMAYEGMGELDKAIYDYSKAIETAYKEDEVYIKREQHTEYLDKVKSDFIKGIERNPYYTSSYYYKDDYKVTGIAPDSSILNAYRFHWSKVIEIASEYSDPYINRGRLYIKAGQLDKALSDFNKAIEINPDSHAGYNNRSYLHYLMGNMVEYKNDMLMAAQLHPLNISIHTAQAAFDGLQGQRVQALGNINKPDVQYSNSPYRANYLPPDFYNKINAQQNNSGGK